MSYERKLAPDQPAANDPKYVVIELRARIAELEAENHELQAERDNVPNVVALMKRAEQAEAELAALWNAHSKHHPSCEDCGQARP